MVGNSEQILVLCGDDGADSVMNDGCWIASWFHSSQTRFGLSLRAPEWIRIMPGIGGKV